MACNSQACMMMFQDFMRQHEDPKAAGKGGDAVAATDAKDNPNGSRPEENGPGGQRSGLGPEKGDKKGDDTEGGKAVGGGHPKEGAGAADCKEGPVFNEEYCKHTNIRESPISVAINF